MANTNTEINYSEVIALCSAISIIHDKVETAVSVQRAINEIDEEEEEDELKTSMFSVFLGGPTKDSEQNVVIRLDAILDELVPLERRMTERLQELTNSLWMTKKSKEEK